MWRKIKSKLEHLPYFGVSDVAQYVGVDNKFAGQLLSRWMKKEWVYRIKRGIYMGREYWVRHGGELGFVEMVASIINPESYLSKEYVLQKHAVLTDVVYGVTSVTTNNTSKVINKMGSYLYYHIKPELFGGYGSRSNGAMVIREASLGKALFDYLYFRNQGWTYSEKNYNLTEDLRLNLDELSKGDWDEFEDWVAKSKSKKMRAALENIKRNL